MKMPKKIKMKHTVARAQVGVFKRVGDPPPPPPAIVFTKQILYIYIYIG